MFKILSAIPQHSKHHATITYAQKRRPSSSITHIYSKEQTSAPSKFVEQLLLLVLLELLELVLLGAVVIVTNVLGALGVELAVETDVDEAVLLATDRTLAAEAPAATTDTIADF
jgi:hypothetical protein